MKKVVFIILIALSANVFSQEMPMDFVANKYSYSAVINADSINKNTLYSNALTWFATSFKSSNDVIQLKDEVNGKIIGKAAIKINYYSRNPIVYFTITLSVKDNKYKYTITDFSYKDNQNETFNLEDFPKSWAGKSKLLNSVDAEIKQILSTLSKSMLNKPEAENW